MQQQAKFSDAPLHLEFHEAPTGMFFWLYRSADGWIVAESDRTYRDLELCVSAAYEYLSHAFAQDLTQLRTG